MKSLFVFKNDLSTFTDDPNMKNVTDIPIVKNIVFLKVNYV
ncbi:hypothetical protein Q5M85_19760 [Paraclostridium bifermentans]|nr:hypothetical protein [Paraclostridium bifermentans]